MAARNRKPVELSNSSSKDQIRSGETLSDEGPSKLLSFDQLPDWRRDNAFIRHGYLPSPIPPSILAAWHVIFSLHNETANIHTHLTPGLIFGSLIYLHPRLTDAPRGLFLPFYLGAFVCLSISSFYHATQHVSLNVARRLNQADYLGIPALIIGCFVPSLRLGFHCHPQLQTIYITMILTLGVAGSLMTVTPRFRTPAWRSTRAAMYATMGLSAVLPVVHGLLLYGRAALEDRIALSWLVSQGMLNLGGATLYALRFPERLAPGRFDYLGSSHQIFHAMVVAAAVVHWFGLVRAAHHQQHELVCHDLIS